MIRYVCVCAHLQINAALIVPNGSDTVALGRNFEIQIPSTLFPSVSLSLSLPPLSLAFSLFPRTIPRFGIKAKSATEYFTFA